MHKAVFIDRDGTIAKDIGYCDSADNFRLLNGVPQGLELLRDLGFKLILVTNQSGIGRGFFREVELWQIHTKLLEILKIYNITLDGIYYCPHNPEKEKCLCRKPESLLFEFAIKQHKIDVASSWMIGDSDADIIAANKVGLKTIFIGKKTKLIPDVKASCFLDACESVSLYNELAVAGIF